VAPVLVLSPKEEEEDMKPEAIGGAARQRKPFFTPLLFRKIHKWVGLILGLQFILWTSSGAVMALLDKDKVRAHSHAEHVASAAGWPDSLVPLPAGLEVDSLTLRRVLDTPVYEFRERGGIRLLNAQTGGAIEVNEALATEIARTAFDMKEVPIVSVSLLQRANLEARDHVGPMWRIDFADSDNTSAYVHAETAQPLVKRTDSWRIWDFAWMLHNMDYADRKSFNHPLIIFVAFGTLWISLTGFYLLFKSFRRREFRWILGRETR
jgi:hypothetical protein